MGIASSLKESIPQYNTKEKIIVCIEKRKMRMGKHKGKTLQTGTLRGPVICLHGLRPSSPLRMRYRPMADMVWGHIKKSRTGDGEITREGDMEKNENTGDSGGHRSERIGSGNASVIRARNDSGDRHQLYTAMQPGGRTRRERVRLRARQLHCPVMTEPCGVFTYEHFPSLPQVPNAPRCIWPG